MYLHIDIYVYKHIYLHIEKTQEICFQATFIKMIENHAENNYSHGKLREIFSLDRQVTLNDI